MCVCVRTCVRVCVCVCVFISSRQQGKHAIVMVRRPHSVAGLSSVRQVEEQRSRLHPENDDDDDDDNDT